MMENTQIVFFMVSAFDFTFTFTFRKLFPVQKLYKILPICFLVLLLFLFLFFQFHIYVFNPGSANYGPWVKSSPLPIFVNKTIEA